MTESKDKNSSSLRERFKMDPPDNAWNLLSAELERKQAAMYKQRGNRFKLLSIGLALLLVSITAYYYISPLHLNNLSSPGKKAEGSAAHNDINEVNNKSLSDNVSRVSNKADVLKGGLGARDLGRSSLIPRPLSNKHPASSNVERRPGSDNDKQNNLSNSVVGNSDNNEIDNSSKTPLKQAAEVSNSTSAKNKTDDRIGKINSIEASAIDNNDKHEADADIMLQPILVNSQKSSPIDALASNDGKGRSRWSIAAFYSPNYYAANHLTMVNSYYNYSSDDYSKREKSEFSYAAGAAMRYDFKSELGCLNRRYLFNNILFYKASDSYASYGADDQLHYIYPTSCGNIEMPCPNSSVLHQGDSLNATAACNQVVEFISIPVTIRFQIVKNRFTFYTNAGLSLNFVAQEKADVTISGTKTTIINNIDGLKNMNYSYLAGVGIEYSLLNGLGVFVEPSLKGSITSLTENTSFYCYPYSFGVNTGLSFHF